MANVRNTEKRVLNVALKEGKTLTLFPGLNKVEDDDWKKALTLKWVAKLYGRGALEGSTEIGDVKLMSTKKESKEVKGSKEKNPKKSSKEETSKPTDL